MSSNVKITSTSQRHLGAVIGDIKYKEQYVSEKINSLIDQTELLAKIAETETEPQAAYSAFIAGFKSKLNYMMRTIPNMQDSGIHRQGRASAQKLKKKKLCLLRRLLGTSSYTSDQWWSSMF